jgi:hypothetical protein
MAATTEMGSDAPRVRGFARLAALVTAALLAAAASAGAQVTTFGADLGQPDNVAFDCSSWPVPLLGGGVNLVPTGAQSCTWTTLGTTADVTHSLFVPAGNGTVTQVRVKVGGVTGPMQVVVLQGLREEFTNNTGCCQQVGQSQMFTPQANAITTVPVQLPVRNDITPDQNHIFAFDILGLSILAPGVPIPAFDTGNHTNTGPFDDVDFPASQPNASIQPDDAFGYWLLMNADWVPGGGGPGAPPGGVPVQSGPPLAFETPAALVQRNQAIIDLTCALAAPCVGNLVLQNQPAPGAVVIPMTRLAGGALASASEAQPEAKAKHVVTYGRGSFNVLAGTTGMVSAQLKPLARRLTRRHRTLQVWANMTLTSTTPAQVVSGQLTLSR